MAQKFAFNFDFAKPIGLFYLFCFDVFKKQRGPASLLFPVLQIALCRRWRVMQSVVSLYMNSVAQRQRLPSEILVKSM